MEKEKLALPTKIYQSILWGIIFPFILLTYIPLKIFIDDVDNEKITFREYIFEYFNNFKTIWE